MPSLRIKSLLESNPLKSELLIGGLGVMIIIRNQLIIITIVVSVIVAIIIVLVRPVRLLRVWVSEGLTQADS